jgi:mannosyl-oligosaccharide alpha-1,3-glucosidase
MPPIHSLGYNFAKYEKFDASDVMARNSDFTKYGFPVDVFWFDIEHAQDHEYTVFDTKRFEQKHVMEMNNAINESQRRFVAIVDPHVRANDDFHVYKDGMQL